MSSNGHLAEETNQNATSSNNLLEDPALLGIDEPLKLKTRKKIAKLMTRGFCITLEDYHI